MAETEKRSRNASVETDLSKTADVEAPETEIDLLELFYYLLENIKLLIIAAATGAVFMLLLSLFVLTPKYEATAKLYVMSQSDSAINLSDLQIGSYLTSDYQEVFKAWEVHEQVLQNLGLDYTYEELEGMLEITNPSDTRMLYITVNSSDPKEATDMANEYARVARDYIYNMMGTDEPSFFSVALEPLDPVSPRKALNTILGLLVAGLIMAAILVVRFIRDDKIKTADDITKYIGIPTLAIVPAVGTQSRRYSAQSKGRQGRPA